MNLPPDLDQPWCRELLSSPGTEIVSQPTAKSDHVDFRLSNSMFSRTLYTPTGIRAQINFRRPTKEPDAARPWEFCFLLSVGDGLDGKTGRAHGGFNALLLDQITGTVAAEASGAFAPATATMTVDYKAPIDTPGIILCRGWAIDITGRKNWIKGSIEDPSGKVFASAKALFVSPRIQNL
ncbi:hypothetical protein PV10_08100 [Exophiala mesophila]|uniref:Thioesterase domain-containing protein n=1 Tax=Exophiala mesophila TaxID=212818 RepID=A0A0D1Z3D7_EXOME|nr:uncharacterized protein PV10_08100 [Exophiala mesophila]KIV88414.1 hypothetical protein PV10_08100 [Exophiala mesophila]